MIFALSLVENSKNAEPESESFYHRMEMTSVVNQVSLSHTHFLITTMHIKITKHNTRAATVNSNKKFTKRNLLTVHFIKYHLRN
jgi:hypothetical protein